MTTRSAFEQALAHLLPQGAAWPRDAQSVWMRLLAGVAANFAELHDWTLQATREWLPQATRTRLAEWEAATGLPDPCLGPLQEPEARRAAVLARLRGYQGVYADSSPAALGGIQAFINALGVPAQVHYRSPLRVGRDRAGHRLGSNDGRLYVLLANGTVTRFRVRTNRVGQRLATRPAGAAQLACALEAVVPARFEIVVE